MAQVDLPPRFPCWCRATYSWGGETKKDLGFIEGDLIEALNAGDGLWWVGRLRRDPRAIGAFPSNFVKVLDESFQPAPNSRAGSPRDTPPRQISPAKQKSVFRKPFQAYEVAGQQTGVKEREATPDSDKEKLKREKSKFRPYASMKTAKAPAGSPTKPAHTSPSKPAEPEFRLPDLPQRGSQRTARARSPQPMSRAGSHQAPQPHSRMASYDQEQYQQYSRAPQPAPHSRQPSIVDRPRSPLPSTFHDGSAYPQLMSRSPSPNPVQQYHSRAPSPQPFEHEIESPPPPPPAHRVIYQHNRSPSPLPHSYDNYEAYTPAQPSPGGSHMTPSPLRDAMNDVMSSLHDMSMTTSPAPTAENVWSPDEFELVRSQSREKRNIPSQYRPQHLDYSMSPSRQGSQLIQLDRHNSDQGPLVPLKGSQYSAQSRPQTSSSTSSQSSFTRDQIALRNRKSAFELRGSDRLARTYTTKTNATNSTDASQNSASTQATSRSIMSGYSAGGFSATSAGSLARRKFGLGSLKGQRPISLFDTKSSGNLRDGALASESSGSGPSYHDSHSSHQQWHEQPSETAGILGGLNTPRHKRSGFFRKMIESAKTTAKTGAATARATVSSASRPVSRAGSISPTKSLFGGSNKEPTGFGNGVASGPASATGNAARDMGMGTGNEWMQVRRDINRSNSLSHKEQEDRHERAQMLDLMPFRPIDTFMEQLEGDESIDGCAITEPTDFNAPSLALVDKSTRFIASVPPMISAAALAQNYICRPHRSDVQKLRAVFTWVAERVTWEEDFEGQSDARRVIQSRRGCSREIAILVHDMCSAVGLHAEVVRGYLKTPGETPDPESIANGNHYWNAILVDGEWRIMDAALASPSHPRRHDFSGASSQVAENWYFLARPSEICYTHVALLPEQQHIVPAIQHEILAALPCATPTYFRHGLELSDFDDSVLHLEGLEMTQLHIFVPEDVECVAESESRMFARDVDGDLFESGDVVTKPAMSQADWIGGRKSITVKAVLPPDANTSTLKIYAGKRGLMHSIKDNPHSLAFSLPLTHNGQNPPYDFFLRHPTPHAQRHDLYVIQPQCARLCMNNTFVFAVRQHPSALSRFTPDTWGSMSATAGGIRPTSPGPGVPYARPGSAMSMMSATTSIVGGSQYSDSSSNTSGLTGSQLKPAKLAIQTPSQKIIRLTRKELSRQLEHEDSLASTWETVIKISERGTWRGLVLADRSARWCVFAEWECV